MTARTVDDQPERADSSAPPATSADTGPQSPASGTTTTPSSGTTPETPTSTLSGDTEAARAYSSVARTVAQAMSTEVSRARFIETEPVLDLSGDVFEDEASPPTDT